MPDGIVQKLPGFFDYLQKADIMVVLGIFAVVLLAYYTFAKNQPATSIVGLLMSFMICRFTPLFGYLPSVYNQPGYLIKIVAFAIITMLVTRLLYMNSFFEPMNVPTGRELLVFAAVFTGLFVQMALQWWPLELYGNFSGAFQMIFLSEIGRSLWVASPLVILLGLRGDF